MNPSLPVPERGFLTVSFCSLPVRSRCQGPGRVPESLLAIPSGQVPCHAGSHPSGAPSPGFEQQCRIRIMPSSSRVGIFEAAPAGKSSELTGKQHSGCAQRPPNGSQGGGGGGGGQCGRDSGRFAVSLFLGGLQVVRSQRKANREWGGGGRSWVQDTESPLPTRLKEIGFRGSRHLSQTVPESGTALSSLCGLAH